MNETTRGSFATAWWGLRVHRDTAALVSVMAGLALAATVPAVSFGGWWAPHLHAAGAPELAVTGDAFARSPAWLRAEAVRLLLAAFGGVTAATFGVGALGALLLFASRAGARAGEMAIRRAVGARRGGLFAAALIEGGAIAAGAVVIGVPMGLLWTRAVAGGWPGRIDVASSQPLVLLAIAAAATVTAGAALAFVFAPRRPLSNAEARPLGLVIPTVQLGLALVVLAGGSLLGRRAADGATGHGLLAGGQVFRASLPEGDQATRSAAYSALIATARSGGGFDTVSLSGQGSVVGLGTVGIVTTECGRCAYGGLMVPQHSVPAAQQYVSADSFQALGVHLMAGRGITDADDWRAPRVVVVSRGLARLHFQDGRPLGRRLLLGDDPRSWYTVVGVVDDPPVSGLGGALLPPFTVYASVLQRPPRAIELLVRRHGAGPRAGAAPGALIASALGVDERRVVGVSEAALLAGERAPVEWFGRLFTLEGWTALLLAALGTWTQMRGWVASIAPELGLRRAVGAGRARTLALVLFRAAGVGAGGTALGLCLGPAVWGALGTVVRGLPAWDTWLVAGHAALLVTTTLAAAMIPAWSAVRLPPSRLLAA